jgi:hypothetical protein
VRFVPLLIVLVAAIAYYASYWHFWFNPHDESGTACLIAQRLMQGERPWVDFEPGYNLGWFYPLVGIFHFTGVNFLAARAWFFLLSTITALLGYAIVTRSTGSRWAGMAAGLLLVIFPGSQFKNYIPLGEAANTACLLYFLFIPPGERRRRLVALALDGIVLGLTFMVRVELGYFFSAIWLLVLLVTLFDHRLSIRGRFTGALLGVVALAFGVVVAQAPNYAYLRGRGLEEQYWAEYADWFRFLRSSLDQRMAHEKPASTAKAKVAPAAEPAVQENAVVPAAPVRAFPNSENGERSALPKRSLSTILHGPGNSARVLAFLTYAPLIGFAIFLLAGLAGFVRAVAKRNLTLDSAPLQWLLLIGGSLTTFPQFFFFRPDRPHLSEFMPGYMVAMIAGVWLLWPRGTAGQAWRRVLAGAVGLFLAVQFAAYAAYAFQHASAGTIVARLKRHSRFQGENGVRVHTSKKEAAAFQGIYDIVTKSSGPQDYLICFPYMPGYNVMTNRRTYLRNIYVDNATHGESWAVDTIHDIEEKHPPVVITDDRAINGVAASKFSRWAAPVYAYLKKHYTVAGKFETVEVFVVPGAAPAAASTAVPAAAPATPPAPAAPPAP